ncbi:hypothetical protein ACIA6E_00830 [Streptomyces sp. NPDC051815]|uniref:hypothetical protein n=1 Tax=Streptomyces sp. NPDC051815 TaxID=3365674 RepID=UPI00379B7CEE
MTERGSGGALRVPRARVVPLSGPPASHTAAVERYLPGVPAELSAARADAMDADTVNRELSVARKAIVAENLNDADPPHPWTGIVLAPQAAVGRFSSRRSHSEAFITCPQRLGPGGGPSHPCETERQPANPLT